MTSSVDSDCDVINVAMPLSLDLEWPEGEESLSEEATCLILKLLNLNPEKRADSRGK